MTNRYRFISPRVLPLPPFFTRILGKSSMQGRDNRKIFGCFLEFTADDSEFGLLSQATSYVRS